MGLRQNLQTYLETLTPNVYFQPPANVKMVYPCIVYKIDNAITRFADNRPYTFIPRYQITIIDQNPDSDIPVKVAALRMCIFERRFTKNNLHHEVYGLYF